MVFVFIHNVWVSKSRILETLVVFEHIVAVKEHSFCLKIVFKTEINSVMNKRRKSSSVTYHVITVHMYGQIPEKSMLACLICFGFLDGTCFGWIGRLSLYSTYGGVKRKEGGLVDLSESLYLSVL